MAVDGSVFDLTEPPPAADSSWLAAWARDGAELFTATPRSPGMTDVFGPGCSFEGDAAVLCLVDYYVPSDGEATTFSVWMEQERSGAWRVSSVDEPAAPDDPRSREVSVPRWFTSPSGNIACSLEGDLVRCDTAENTWGVPQPSESECLLSYGDSVAVGLAGPATLFWHGDTNFGAPGSFVLDYAHPLETAYFSCTSEQSGVTCRTIRLDDHGFTVSRSSYQLW